MAQFSPVTVVEALKEHLSCTVLGVSDERFVSATGLWNGAPKERPTALVQCENISHVQQTILMARDHGMPVSVLGGGHDWAGRSLSPESVTIDLRLMRSVSVDMAAKIAIVQGGATAADLLHSIPPELAAVTGTVKPVGITGLTIGGGYGPLNGRFGLALDNMISAQVVLADGTVVRASQEENPDLFWAVRGGGGNYGVVTSMALRLHEVPQVLSALVLFPLPYAAAVLRRYQEILNSAPEELGFLAGFLCGPDGTPMLFLAPLWSDRITKAQHMLTEMTNWEGAIPVHSGLSPYREALGVFDPLVVNGRHHFLETRTLASLDATSASLLIEGARTMSSPVSGIVIHDFHGVATRVAPEATAFPLRKSHLMVEIISAWDDSPTDDGERHRKWANAVSASLESSALPGGYVNILAPHDLERAKQFYGVALPRLKQIKHVYDPNDVFRFGVGAV